MKYLTFRRIAFLCAILMYYFRREGNVTGLGTLRTALYPQTECIGTTHDAV